LRNFNSLNITHLQFADDLLIFLNADERQCAALKLLLSGFENMTGLKINYSKSEVISLNLTTHKENLLAQILECKIESLPIKYLGVPLHNKKLRKIYWDFLLNKISNKLDTWQGKLLSLGGRLILIRSVLNVISIYWMIIFRLPSHIRYRINQLCKKFLWFGGHSVRKKIYCLVAWKIVYNSCEQSGLGILNLHLMNKALLYKWLWRFNSITEKRL
jgi:Reverse transcriptase (RNA-dependent DNA polymerase)